MTTPATCGRLNSERPGDAVVADHRRGEARGSARRSSGRLRAPGSPSSRSRTPPRRTPWPSAPTDSPRKTLPSASAARQAVLVFVSGLDPPFPSPVELTTPRSLPSRRSTTSSPSASGSMSSTVTRLLCRARDDVGGMADRDARPIDVVRARGTGRHRSSSVGSVITPGSTRCVYSGCETPSRAR